MHAPRSSLLPSPVANLFRKAKTPTIPTSSPCRRGTNHRRSHQRPMSPTSVIMNITTTSLSVPELSGHVMGGVPGTNSSPGHGGGGGNDCKISMLWNWDTVDACFISSTWQITSTAVFAGSCVGVILLAVVLEALRRAVKEYDRLLLRRHAGAALFRISMRGGALPDRTPITAAEAKEFLERDSAATTTTGSDNGNGNGNSNSNSNSNSKNTATTLLLPFRPTLVQQVARAALHTVQFAVAYLLMMLAMYYNGYFIICIFVGAFLGAMIFQWEAIGGGEGQTSAAKEDTVCCG